MLKSQRHVPRGDYLLSTGHDGNLAVKAGHIGFGIPAFGEHIGYSTRISVRDFEKNGSYWRGFGADTTRLPQSTC